MQQKYPLIDEQRVHPDVEIRKITKTLRCKGKHPHPLCFQKTLKKHTQRGVFATKKIPKNTFLGEYVGEIHIVSKSFSQKGFFAYSWRLSFHEGYDIVIDGQKYANEFVFVNDYRNIQAHPNVKAKMVIHRGFLVFGYQTLLNIDVDEELLVDYGKKYGEYLNKMNLLQKSS